MRVKYLVYGGKVREVPCVNHSFRWSGSIPCTGVYACVHCGIDKQEAELLIKGEMEAVMSAYENGQATF